MYTHHDVDGHGEEAEAGDEDLPPSLEQLLQPIGRNTGGGRSIWAPREAETDSCDEKEDGLDSFGALSGGGGVKPQWARFEAGAADEEGEQAEVPEHAETPELLREDAAQARAMGVRFGDEELASTDESGISDEDFDREYGIAGDEDVEDDEEALLVAENGALKDDQGDQDPTSALAHLTGEERDQLEIVRQQRKDVQTKIDTMSELELLNLDAKWMYPDLTDTQIKALQWYASHPGLKNSGEEIDPVLKNLLMLDEQKLMEMDSKRMRNVIRERRDKGGFFAKLCMTKRRLNTPEKRNFVLGYQREQDITQKALRISFVGKPNAGKSSLINALLQKPRMVVHFE